MNRGEVWWARAPPTWVDARSACSRAKSRSRPSLRDGRACDEDGEGIPTEVPLACDDGMPASCALTLDNVTAFRNALLTARSASLAGPAPGALPRPRRWGRLLDPRGAWQR